MQAGLITLVKTDKDVHFTGAIAQNAQANENIGRPYTPEALVAGLAARGRLRSIQISATENLAYEIRLYRTDGFNNTDADLNKLCGWWAFSTGDATRVAAAGLYNYYVDGLDILYYDEDQTGEVHVGLVNRSVASKTAGAGGEMTVVLGFEPV